MVLYEIAILGEPSPTQQKGLLDALENAATAFGIEYGREFVAHVGPSKFAPSQRSVAVAVYFGGPTSATYDLGSVLDLRGVTVVPVASTEDAVATEIPAALRYINCHITARDGIERLYSTVLECLGLLRRQRRVFLSYRRNEARVAALQVHDELCRRGFDVFLDTHAVASAMDFQEVLWHKLCDSDVMVMLETKTYFNSRWTTEEFGRALSKNIGVLRVQWPDATPSIRTKTCSRVELIPSEVNPSTGEIDQSAVKRISDDLERFRSLSFAVRRISAVTQLFAAIDSIGGCVRAVGPHFTMRVTLPSGRDLSVTPVMGVPDAKTLQDAIVRANGEPSAIVYDHVGVMPEWNAHLQWLGNSIPDARWIRSSQAAWDLAGCAL